MTADTRISEAAMVAFAKSGVPVAALLTATAGNSPNLTAGFRAGWSSMNSARGGLAL
jgi:hypothetical protein